MRFADSPFPAESSRTSAEAGEPWLEQCSSGLFISNPESTHAAGHAAVLACLRESNAGERLGIEQATTSPYLDDNVATIQSTNPDTLIIVRAGDGGVSAILQAVLAAGRQNPVFVVPGGNKNDIAHQLFSAGELARPDRALERAHLRETQPIQIEGMGYAFGYISFGTSATVASIVNSKAYKNRGLHKLPGGRFVDEYLTSVKTYCGSQPLSVSIGDHEPVQCIDILAANGSRMAGVFHPDANLFEPGFRFIKTPGKLRGLSTITALLSGFAIGEDVPEGKSVPLTIEAPHAAFLQIDGEHQPLTDRMSIRLSTAPQGVTLVTTR